MSEHIDFKDGKIQNAAFSAYQVPRLADVPPLDLVFLNRKDLPSVGAGETPIIAVAPAVANALWQASQRRSRELPLRV
jgi:isoquinoline 1-oxidoreductase